MGRTVDENAALFINAAADRQIERLRPAACPDDMRITVTDAKTLEQTMFRIQNLPSARFRLHRSAMRVQRIVAAIHRVTIGDFVSHQAGSRIVQINHRASLFRKNFLLIKGIRNPLISLDDLHEIIQPRIH